MSKVPLAWLVLAIGSVTGCTGRSAAWPMAPTELVAALVLTGPTYHAPSTCSPAFAVTATAAGGFAASVAAPLPIALTTTGAASFGDPACVDPIDELTLPRGAHSAAFYVSDTTAEAVSITASAAEVPPVSFAAEVSPVPPGLEISAGEDHSCAIYRGGAWCWGSNAEGQLGDGTLTDSRTPVRVTGLARGVTVISAGRRRTCAVVDGAALCWGANDGVLGNDDWASQPTPTPVVGLTSQVTAVSISATHGCAVMNGGAWCWGQRQFGVLGDGTASTDRAMTPVQVQGLTTGVRDIVAGYTHTCALVGDGVQCWGRGSQLGVDGGTTDALTAQVVPTMATGVIHLDGDRYQYGETCGIAGGFARCWATLSAPVNRTALGVTDVAAGYQHACAVVAGAVSCWGHNEVGQLGDGTIAPAGQHQTVTPLGLTEAATRVAAHMAHTCAVVRDNLLCWGQNAAGDGSRLGTGELTDALEPRAIGSLF